MSTGLEFNFFTQDNFVAAINNHPNPDKITSVYIYSGEITDLTPLSRLVNLRYLEVERNDISDIRPLSGLVNLRELIICESYITDIEPLSDLVNLVTLDLWCITWFEDDDGPTVYNIISDFTSLKHLYKISDLSIGDSTLNTSILLTIRGNKCQSILLESILPRNYKCPLSNLREFGILGL